MLRNILLLLLFCFSMHADECPPTVLVSIPPYKYIAERIAGDTLKTLLLLPPGADPHSFEPRPRQIVEASCAKLWFQVGEGFEKRVQDSLKGHRPDLVSIDLRNGMDLISIGPDEAHAHCGHSHDCYDPHLWLSPKIMKRQAAIIADALANTYPEHRTLYWANLRQLQIELDELYFSIQEILEPLQKRIILVSHPAYAYFCRDYKLQQISIEFEGKDPSPKHVTQILQKARSADIHTVFVQVQHSSKGARLIANQLGAKVVELDPLSENYIENMRYIARSFANQ